MSGGRRASVEPNRTKEKAAAVTVTAQGSAAPLAPRATPPADPDLDAELTKLRARGANALERPEIIKRIKGRHLSGSMAIAQVIWTTGLHLSERVRHGQTAVGTMPGGLHVGVSFVKERDAEIQALKRGDVLEFSGRVAHWDDIYDRLLIEAE